MGFLKTLFGAREESPEEKTEKRRERDFNVLKYDGVRACKMGEVKYAIRCFREALALRNDSETASYLAEALLSDKQAEEGRSILAKLAEKLPDHIGVRLAMARADEMMQDYTRMDEDCQAALQIDSCHAGALYRSAQAKHALHDELNAVALLTQAIVQDGHLTEAYLLRAEILRAMGSLTEAEADIDAVLGRTDGVSAVMLKAALRLQQGDAPTAITYYNKVKTQNPLMGEAYVGLSTAYAANRQLDRALSTLDEAVELMPDFSEGYKERGRIKLMLNDKAGATDDLKKALETSPEAAKAVEGQFSNIEQEMNGQYKNRNPYGF